MESGTERMQLQRPTRRQMSIVQSLVPSSRIRVGFMPQMHLHDNELRRSSPLLSLLFPDSPIVRFPSFPTRRYLLGK